LLVTKLSQSKFIRILDINSIYSILKKLNLDEAKKYAKEDLQKVASEGGPSHSLSGSLMKAGDTIIINLTLQKLSTGEAITSQAVPCKTEAELFTKLDEVTTEIKSSSSAWIVRKSKSTVSLLIRGKDGRREAAEFRGQLVGRLFAEKGVEGGNLPELRFVHDDSILPGRAGDSGYFLSVLKGILSKISG
jgi:TolB-like protein